MTTPRLLGSRYEIGEILGYGGMAEVHRGRDVRLGREVAVKVLRADLARDPSFQARFRREAQAAASLNHPAIVAVYDTGEEDMLGNQPYIVMEYVEGRTLRDVLKIEGRLMPRRAMEIVADVCAALDFSHRNGIVHRDVKPGNVMITPTGAVKVMDFGIARAVADNAATVTQTAAVIGTAQYLSPEQARGENVDARSDVYSTGVLLFELITGSPPFTGDSPVAVAYQHVRENPPPPSSLNPDVPPELDAIVLKAMAKNPANRYQSAGEMRADLIRAINGRPVEAEPVMTQDEVTTVLAGGARTGQYAATATRGRPLPPPAAKRSPWFWVGIAAVCLLVLAAAAFATIKLVGSSNDVTVPNLIGQTQAEATKRIQDAGLVPSVSRTASTPQQTGQVVSTDPASGTSLKRGSTVSVVIGGGVATVTLEDYKTLSYEDAAKKVRDKGLFPVRKDVNSSTPEGIVISSDPREGQKVAPGSRVVLSVSTGKTALPNVVGRTEEEATGILNKAGYTNIDRQTLPPPDDQEAGTVFRMDPNANTAVPLDQKITLFIAAAKPTPTPTTPSPTPTATSPTGTPTGTPSGSASSTSGTP
ncbi:MAG TPA: Stk1 family PASTA domain-containing Ser/Thr kinase [Mycobacteriales bacterium]|nr:Stk1 family PASTA domain-containing Ser/Thr kinase [Mycobacteriales bacterium]